MRKLISYCFFGLFFILIFSCDKNDNTTPPTIHPLPYYPAYPGSYWIYTNGDTIKVADKFGLYRYCSTLYNGTPDTELFLPILTLRGDSFAYVKEYSLSNSNPSRYVAQFNELLSPNLGVFHYGIPYTCYRSLGETIKIDTSIIIDSVKYENVIITIHYTEQYPFIFHCSKEECATKREFYAKDVGLIRRDWRNFPTDSLYTTELELIDYYIK